MPQIGLADRLDGFVSLPEAAKLLDLSYYNLRELVKLGKVKGVKTRGRMKLVSLNELKRLKKLMTEAWNVRI